jgi:hypothetical protein
MALRIVLVTFAGIIDLFEIIIEFAMTALGSTAGGAAAGCAAGAAVAGKVGCTVGAALGGFLGLAAQGTGVGEVLGFLMGYILTVCITLSFGTMLITFLVLSGHGKWFPTMYVLGGKLLPFLGLAPGWLIYAWHCTGEDKAVRRAAETNVARIKNAFTPGESLQTNEALA